MRFNPTWDWYKQTHQRMWGTPGITPPQVTEDKPNKMGAVACVVDGIRFPSKLEARCYVDLRWQYKAGKITFPLRQVRFSLGKHYEKKRVYIADFVCISLQSGCVMVVEAKGRKLQRYKDIKPIFERLYGIRITEYQQPRQ